MNDFVDEARSRVAHLLRMANTTDDRIRARIIEYADTTPEPPVMSRAGIVTTGCPRCHRTAWRQHDAEGPVWVCASCGHVEGVIVKCPHCEIPMIAPPLGAPDRWHCPRCPRVAATGESALNIEARERQRVAALAALDEAIAAPADG
ncbi:hypothetical protein [Streptomyces albireticuli]|uniref:hypothetical protein n=1 Tax=Streptomyces albireticuli TaxID=1940 RepID=UPI001E61EE86|nr:hypothetical protein [Streptomyces albireticuli]MCD9141982.1 hypothetical protein [Streptomyces albireticuli]MCD9163074.1 hypothetical protein [Streptomyces albireticuli]MCD9190156.1 hypothetical protein [Streptomyces albireticuli]